jgi:hypothetical protein
MPPDGHSEVTTDVTGSAPLTTYNDDMNTTRLSRRIGVLPVAALTAVLVAACGGAKKPPSSAGSGNPAPPSQSSAVRAAYHYADCMRSHGVKSFGDPKVSSNGSSTSIGFHIDPQMTSSPAFKSAQTKCQHILGTPSNGPTPAQTHVREQYFIAFAKCMREHGFPKFPDPNNQGRLTPAMLSAAGINLQQPAIRPAAYGCLPLTHGLVTKADINQAIANPNGGSQSGSGG